MIRVFWYTLATLLVLSVINSLGLLPAPLGALVSRAVGTAFSLACPLFFLTLLFAPGLFREVTAPVGQFWQRLRSRRLEVEDLRRKIAHLDKPHQMIQLGVILAQQGKNRQAIEWFRRALEKDPASLDAQYRLALCLFEQQDYGQAAELLERVHTAKPNHDYGLANLRLAQSQHRAGNTSRAAEMYETLLRFYPGQPEGSYDFAQLLAEQGDLARAHTLMDDLIFTVRHSPGFQRRRNRHWSYKAHWWKWRHH